MSHGLGYGNTQLNECVIVPLSKRPSGRCAAPGCLTMALNGRAGQAVASHNG